MSKELQSFGKGLNKDINQEFQPKETYRFMLNGLFESLDGEMSGVVNERGTEISINLPTNINDPNLIGFCLLPNQDKVLFLTGNDSTNYPTQPGQEIQIIALHKNNNTYVELIRTNLLEFKKCDQIDCIFKIHNGCDNIIYFTDHKNKYKSINITTIENNTSRYKIPGYTNYLPAPNNTNPNIPTVDPSGAIGTYGWLTNQFFLSSVFNHTDLLLHSVKENTGNLRVGTYTFFIRLLDEDLNPTDWLNYTNPITIKQGPFNSNIPSDNTDGYYEDVNKENFVSKSIVLFLSNLDISFEYYEIGVIERSLNTNLPTFAYRTGQRALPGTNDTFLFDNVEDIRFIDYPWTSLLVTTRKIDVVQAHSQINNRLIVGNLTSVVRDWSQFQRQTNDIQVEYFTYNDVTITQPGCTTKEHYVASGNRPLLAIQAAVPTTYDGYEVVNYSSPDFLSYGMSLMRDEVYALGIVYVFKDGRESPVFHIPGRPKFSTDVGDAYAVATYTIDGFDYANYATAQILSFSSLSTTPFPTGLMDQKRFEESKSGASPGGLADLTGTDRLDRFDTQELSVMEQTSRGSWTSKHLTNLTQYNRPTDTASIATDEYKYLYGYKDKISCCYNLQVDNSSCDSGVAGTIPRWLYYNTALRRKATSGATSWAAADYEGTFSNFYYAFKGGFTGVPGYYDTGVPYPDIKDCEGNRIYPEGNVRHHKMPDHRIEQLFDRISFRQNIEQGPAYPSPAANYPDVDGQLGVAPFTSGGGWLYSRTIAGGVPANNTWLVDSNMNDVTNVDGLTPTNPELKQWDWHDSEASLKLYPIGLNISGIVFPPEYADDIAGCYIVRSNRANNKTVIDKGFFNVCDTTVSTDKTGYTTWNPNSDDIQNALAVDNNSVLDVNAVWPNILFLTPDIKPATYSIAHNTGVKNEKVKQPLYTWWNILEIHTPKSTMNQSVALGFDYIKPEATVFGDLMFNSPRRHNEYHQETPAATTHYSYVGTWPATIAHWQKNWLSTFPASNEWSSAGGDGPKRLWNGGYNTGVSVFLNRHKYPRVTHPVNKDWWVFVYNIPISNAAYANYNTDNSSNFTGEPTAIKNEYYKQKTLLAKYHQSCTPAAATGWTVPPPAGTCQLNAVSGIHDDMSIDTYMQLRSVCELSYPFEYPQLKRDIQRHQRSLNFIGNSPGDTFLNNLDTIMVDSYYGQVLGEPNSWSRAGWTVIAGNQWSIGASPYMYYGALKSSIRPYLDFDGITYIKMHSYQVSKTYIDANPSGFAITGGDTFINRFQFEKSYREAKGGTTFNWWGNDNDVQKYLSALTVGYVESEINSAFRHLLDGDLFRTYPFDGRWAIWEWLNDIVLSVDSSTKRDELDEIMAKQNIINRYKLDYSSYNSEIPKYQLPSTWDFCSNCSETFPNTLYYSQVSIDSQSQDFYKLFITNAYKSIPSYTGEIQNIFVKDSDLYIHTNHNLWKMSVAPQTMKTNADTIEVGQGEFLGREPVKMFNNEDAFSRGGTVDKFTSIFAMGNYIWFDRNSRSLLSLSNDIKSISDIGMSKWFDRNAEVTLDTQFRNLTGLPYPYKGTSCNVNVGYIAVMDPEHDRYMLTKKDYELLSGIISGMTELTTNAAGTLYVPAIVTTPTTYYYDDYGFYVGILAGNDVSLKNTLLAPIDYTDKALAKNKSWTLSYSLKSQVWSSFHSYIPNWLYYDSKTFYSFVANATDGINLKIWEHNYGNFQTYYGNKFDFVIDYIYKQNSFQDKTFDSIEYTSNVWLKSTPDDTDIEIPFITFDRFFVYNNNQLSNLKTIDVSNFVAYANTLYDITKATAHKWRNIWKINKLRDLTVNKWPISGSTEPKFTKDWSELTYSNEYNNGFGYIDKVINPAIIDITKDVYQIERLTDKYLGVRLFFNPGDALDYKITLNLITGTKRNKV